MIESLTWQAVFAIVGSVVVIVTGIFGYLIKTRNGTGVPLINKDSSKKTLTSEYSEVRERLIQIESDIKILSQHGRNSNRRLDEHIAQDERNFSQINHKIDKLTDILMKILTDDKL